MQNPESTKPEPHYERPDEIAPGVAFPDTPGELKNYQVGMSPSDPGVALNFSLRTKAAVLVIVVQTITVTTWGSAVIAPALEVLMLKFHIGLPVASLTVSLYVAGFAVGPIFWGPFSSLYGRKIPIMISSFGLTLFMFAAATSKDYQTLVISRFFQGVFGAGPITVGPAIVGDTFKAHHRGTALTAASLGIIAGPMVAPVVGGYIVQSYLGWRWTQYITGIWAGFATVFTIFLPETFTTTLLQHKASQLRSTTGNWAVRAPGELENANVKEIITNTFFRPFKMMVSEPILALLNIYHGLIYGILYMCLEAIPIIFSGFKFKGANVFLPYLSLLVGAIIVCLLNMFVFEKYYNLQLLKHKKPVIPENRLPLMIISGFAFVIAVFWICWTGAYPKSIHWIVPVIGMAFFGFGLIGVFLTVFNYILDSYLMMSAQAFASNTFVRSAFGCAFPLFVHPMFINLGIQWAGTLIGCLSALLIPVPILFYIYGAKLRSISRYAINLDDFKKDAKKDAEKADEASKKSSVSKPEHSN